MEHKPKKKPLALLKDAAVGLFIAAILSYLILSYLILNTYSPTGSMSPTLEAGYHAIANRLAYSFSAPQRGDIVAFQPESYGGTRFVKRIIGLPGETVDIRDGVTYINGTALDEPYLAETMTGEWGPFTVPNDSYFLMGDNRNQSEDCRHWESHFVFMDDILGQVVFSYYPDFKVL